MSDIKILCITFPWGCDCCGYGQHVAVSIYDNKVLIWRGTYNDQFGGPLTEGDEVIRTSDAYEYVSGMRKAYEVMGHEVTLYMDGVKVDE
jgi:hypothetical protein